MNVLDVLLIILIAIVVLCFVALVGGGVLFAIYLIFSKRDGELKESHKRSTDRKISKGENS